ncbi:MAG: PEP-CTERM sorting domain-containing protein [Alphaproteobacteria bacterium]|nr:MAG: PEP-CTERM sorting domain-containing protein [Alphaproteobacteria bacterium]
MVMRASTASSTPTFRAVLPQQRDGDQFRQRDRRPSAVQRSRSRRLRVRGSSASNGVCLSFNAGCTFSVAQAVPEPSALALFLAGVSGLTLLRWRRRPRTAA